YFEIQDQVLEYRNIWIPLLDTLVGNFINETGEEIGFPEYIALNIILFLLKKSPTEVGLLIWGNNLPRFDPEQIKIRDIIDPIMNNAPTIIPKLQQYFQQNARLLRKKFQVKLNDQEYTIARKDTKRITQLFRSLDEQDPYLDQVINADSKLFPTDDDLVGFVNDLLRYFICVTHKQPILLIGMDEIAKADQLGQNEFYLQLGKLFVSLRNKLNFTLFVFISTTEDWSQYDKSLTQHSDLNNQISDFMVTMPLTYLPIEDVNLIFQKRMNEFWNRKPQIRHSLAPFYPFTENTFDFAYRFMNNDLRLAIHLLRDMWLDFKYTKKIPLYLTKFDCMRNIRQFKNSKWDLETLRRFEWTIIQQEYDKPGRFNTNSQRSSAVETALETAWRVMMNTRITSITNVENNPNIRIKGHSHRPDVVVKLNDPMGSQYRRIIEFQVKAYSPDSYVALKHIESSLTLFEQGYSDFLYFLITGRGLSPKAMERIEELRRNYPNRIRTPILNSRQKKYLDFLMLFEEILGLPMGNQHESLVYNALNVIYNQPPEVLIQEIIDLPARDRTTLEDFQPDSFSHLSAISTSNNSELTPNLSTYMAPSISSEATTTKIPQIQKKAPIPIDPSPITTSQPKNITSIQKRADILDETSSSAFPLETNTSWIKCYPYFESYKEELCGVCQYMKKREDGRYKGKFTHNVILKNVIVGNPSLSKKNYKELVKILQSNDFIYQEKTSYIFTDQGWVLYFQIKEAGYKY
ncbi:MAG: hypothetical protein ACTSUI_01400, partial [Promethearchaeota archaeon]